MTEKVAHDGGRDPCGANFSGVDAQLVGDVGDGPRQGAELACPLPFLDLPQLLDHAKEAEIARCDAEGTEIIGQLSERELLIAGAVLYAGEVFKTDTSVGMANTDPAILTMFVAWLRRCFNVDESRLRVRLYLHEGLDLEAAQEYWSQLLQIPRTQFRKPYRAIANPTRRTAKHAMGCPAVVTRTRRPTGV